MIMRNSREGGVALPSHTSRSERNVQAACCASGPAPRDQDRWLCKNSRRAENTHLLVAVSALQATAATACVSMRLAGALRPGTGGRHPLRSAHAFFQQHSRHAPACCHPPGRSPGHSRSCSREQKKDGASAGAASRGPPQRCAALLPCATGTPAPCHPPSPACGTHPPPPYLQQGAWGAWLDTGAQMPGKQDAPRRPHQRPGMHSQARPSARSSAQWPLPRGSPATATPAAATVPAAATTVPCGQQRIELSTHRAACWLAPQRLARVSKAGRTLPPLLKCTSSCCATLRQGKPEAGDAPPP